jgi:hypothetical protein
MKADSGIQQTWSRILRKVNQPGDLRCHKLGEGYYAVAHRPGVGKGTVSLAPAADYPLLRTRIPHFARTRAVPLNFRHDFDLAGITSLKSWAGELAADIEAGLLLAFAVVDLEMFGETAAVELRATGWEVEGTKEELRVTDGFFVQQVNLLRVIVEMVLTRSEIGEARRALREKVAGEFRLYKELFRRFARRFQKFQPAVLDHYFTAYPGASCVSAGWDYWEVSGKASSEAEQIFERGMQEFEAFLTPYPDAGLSGFLAGACQGQICEGASPSTRRWTGLATDGSPPGPDAALRPIAPRGQTGQDPGLRATGRSALQHPARERGHVED